MAVALKRFYRGDTAIRDRELEIFQCCNDKVGKILQWTSKDEGSMSELRQLGLSRGGLLNASVRRWAWPSLLQIQQEDITDGSFAFGATSDHLDLIRQDVQRSDLFRSRTVAGSIIRGEQASDLLQTKLVSVLSAAVSTPLGNGSEDQIEPCYYQGLHDVASILLLNLNYDEAMTTCILRKLMATHLKEAVKKDFSNITILLDTMILPLIQCLDEEVYMALVESGVPLTSCILPWLITLFTHSVQDEAVASRLMDAFVANGHPMLPFYVAVALLTHPLLRSKILEAGSCCDPGMMHMAIQELPSHLKNDLECPASGKEAMFVTTQDVLDLALAVMEDHPPESLLRFVGANLGKKLRRRLRDKIRGISMLQIPARPSKLRVQADRLWEKQALIRAEASVCWEGLCSSVPALYETARCKGKEAVATWNEAKALMMPSDETVMCLQVVATLLVMLPHQYVASFYCLIQMAMALCTTATLMAHVSGFRRASNGKNNLNSNNNDPYLSVEARDEIPEMVESLSVASLSDHGSVRHQRTRLIEV